MKREVRLVSVVLGGIGLVLGLLGFLTPLEAAADRSASAAPHYVDPAALSDTLEHVPLVDETDTLGENAPYANCRYGVVASATETQQFDLVENLSAGWYMDFGRQMSPREGPELEYVQLLHVSQDRPIEDPFEDPCGPDYGYAITPALTADGLGELVAANPGSVWVIGNEPERIRQDDVCPQQYAEAYHDAYHFIKAWDPTAKVAVAGLVEVTPGRLQYLDIVRGTYRQNYGHAMPVDVWTMHVYILPETGDGDAHIALGTDPDLAIGLGWDCSDPDTYCYAEHDDLDLFIEQVELMRRWMKRNGYQDRPLLLTEYGVNLPYHYPTPDNPNGRCSVQRCDEGPSEYCFCDTYGETFHPERVADFMEATFDYLSGVDAVDPNLGYPDDGYRLVQQWMWYRVYTDPPAAGHASNLADAENGYAMTVPAQRWNAYVANVTPQLNLVVDMVPAVAGRVLSAGDVATVTLSGVVFNNGNTALGPETTATFYRDSELTDPIGSVVFTGVGGCARHYAVLTTTWPSLSVGFHPFWFRVDSLGVISETDETDNVGQGVVLIGTHQFYLPLVARGG